MDYCNDHLYDMGWADYRQRSNWLETLTTYLSSERAINLIGYDNFQHAVSVGPG